MIKKPYIFFTNNLFNSAAYTTIGGAQVSYTTLFGNNSALITTFDSQAVTMDIWFTNTLGDYQAQTFDSLLIQNTNAKTLNVYTLDSEGNSVLWHSFTNLAEKSFFYQGNAMQTSAVRFEFIDTQDGANLYIGLIKAFKYLLSLFAYTTTKISKDFNAGAARTYNGDLYHFSSYNKWEASLEIENLTKDQFDVLNNQIETTSRMIIVPWEDFDDTDIYECYISPEFDRRVNRRTSLMEITIKPQEL